MTESTLTVQGLEGKKACVSTGLFIDISGATAEDVDAAVISSSRAYEMVWRQTTGARRRQLLLKLADLIERDMEIFAILEGSDVGALVSTTTGGLGPMACEWIRYFAGWADKIDGRSADWDQGLEKAGFSYTRREPYGVTAAIGQMLIYLGC
jgi:aldehyde dehydrogenase (NAD+)